MSWSCMQEVAGILTGYRNHRKLNMSDKQTAELRLSRRIWSKGRELLSWVFLFVRISVYALNKCNRFHQLIVSIWDHLH